MFFVTGASLLVIAVIVFIIVVGKKIEKKE